MNTFERTEMALDLLVQNCLEAQETRNKYDSLAALKEFQTVKIYGPRQTGHTVSAIKIARKYFKDFIYVGINSTMAKAVASNQGLESYQAVGADEVLRVLRGSKYALGGRIVECVIVDCTFFLSANKLDEIMETVCHFLAHSEKKCLMLIQ